MDDSLVSPCPWPTPGDEEGHPLRVFLQIYLLPRSLLEKEITQGCPCSCLGIVLGRLNFKAIRTWSCIRIRNVTSFGETVHNNTRSSQFWTFSLLTFNLHTSYSPCRHQLASSLRVLTMARGKKAASRGMHRYSQVPCCIACGRCLQSGSRSPTLLCDRGCRRGGKYALSSTSLVVARFPSNQSVPSFTPPVAQTF
jgi:hypothetical protein